MDSLIRVYGSHPKDSLTETLMEFWDRAEDCEEVSDRLLLLTEFAERLVYRKRAYKKVRRKRGTWQLLKKQWCWACRLRRADVSHHIVQVQYGGSNGPECELPLCHGCHAVIHPWMRKKAL